MIVCICNGLCEQRCRNAAKDPDCRSVGCVYRQLGCRVRCGKCVPFMRDLLGEVKQSEADRLPEGAQPAAVST